MTLTPEQMAEIEAQRSAPVPTLRAVAPGMEQHLYTVRPVLDHGFVRVIDYMGEVPWEEDTMAKAWYARIKSRPSFRPLLADQVRGLPAATHYADLDF